MQDLISEGIARLAGASSRPCFTSSRPWEAARRTRWSALPAGQAPSAEKRVLYGLIARRRVRRCRHSSLQRPQQPDHFFWGEIAEQLGKGDEFRVFWTAGPKAPDEKDWLKLLDGDRPVLILLDEMPPYFHYLDTQKVGNGTVADIATRAFANLLTAAGKKKNVCVVVSDLAAAYDTGARSSIVH